jgi:lipooligosaccharide transport system permease protein
VCASTMNSATFEAMYSAFSRMQMQKTWEAIMTAPLTLEDVVLAELVWAASKSFMAGLAILLVVWSLGLSASWLSLWVLPVIPLIGLCFGALALTMTALAPSYDFFMYYFTLVVTPMTMLCGVFFPTDRLPGAFQTVASVLPLSHATLLVRPLLLGAAPDYIALHVAVLVAYAAGGYCVALILLRRRLSS